MSRAAAFRIVELRFGFLALAAAWALAPTACAQADRDDAEINAALTAYQAAYNRGDVDALMAVWSPQADFISFTGQHYQGREAITALFRTAFAETPGRSIQLEVTHRQRLSDDTVMDDGVLQLNAPDGRIDRGRYVTIWGRENGKWVVRSVRDMPPLADPAPRDPLGGLAWLEGSWRSADGQVTLEGRWRGKRKFLEQRFTIAGETPLEVFVLVGWDPNSQQIRSWFFDTAGGFGEGLWSQRDDGWRVVVSGALPDGRLASSVETWTPGDARPAGGEAPSAFAWRSTEREVAGQHVPDLETQYARAAGSGAEK